jgi:NADH-quinone oxidoreductase subunit M
MVAVGTVGIVYGGIVAAMQKNLKRLVAYSSVSHMGFCIIGLFALNTQGIQGSVMQMVNHGITTGALFILLGFLYQRRHTYEIADLKGIQKVAPVFAGLFTLMMLASIGLPGLNGFVGEFLTLLGTFLAFEWWALIPATGVILAALYLLWAYQRVFHGEPDEANSRFGDLELTEKLLMVPLVILVVFLGIYPKPVLDRIEPSVTALVDHVERNVPGWRSPESENGRDLRPVEGRLEAGGHGEGDTDAHEAESGTTETGAGAGGGR